MKRFLWLGFVLSCYLICTGCGDTFRPIIIPNPPTFPNPAASHTVVAINDNGNVVPGSAMSIDVSGDSISTVADCTGALCIGVAPVHAVQQTASQVLVVNQAVTAASVGNMPTTSCLVTYPSIPPNQVFNVCSSVTKVNFNGANISGTTAISLPIYAGASFVAVAPNDTLAYVTMPTFPPDPTQPTVIVPSVGVVNTLSNNLVATISVGSNPDALAVTPDKSKLYVANQGDRTVSGFNTKDRSARIICVNAVCPVPPANTPIPLSSPPIWLVARSDNQRVYVLESDGTTGTLAWLDTSTTAGPDALTETAISVPGAVQMVYDGNLNRLYIPGGNRVAIVDVSQSAPLPITALTITPTTPPGCAAIGGATFYTVDVAALPDETRAYTGSYYEDADGNICPQVTAIDAGSFSQTTIAIPGFPAYDDFCSPGSASRHARFRLMMAAGGDSNRAYLSSCDGGNVNFIDTTTNTYFQNLPAPAGSRPNNPPQNPVFLLAGP
jgi:DNA-binding beta-propeller fold protein YncE